MVEGQLGPGNIAWVRLPRQRPRLADQIMGEAWLPPQPIRQHKRSHVEQGRLWQVRWATKVNPGAAPALPGRALTMSCHARHSSSHALCQYREAYALQVVEEGIHQGLIKALQGVGRQKPHLSDAHQLVMGGGG